MRRLSPSDSDSCLPFVISDVGVTPGAMLGGRPPAAVTPPGAEPRRFFATVPVAEDPALFASIFVADMDLLMRCRGEVTNSNLVSIVVHPETGRGVATPFDSPLSEHALQLLSPVADAALDDDGVPVPRSGHKLGGRPHIVRPRARLLAELGTLLADGYSQVVQFDFPHGRDAVVSGDWPFADGMFCVLARESSGWSDWRWYWDF